MLENIKSKQENIKNVGVFVDYDNIYYGLKDYGVNHNDDSYCIFNLMDNIYGKEKIRTMRAYADFDQVTDVKFKSLQEKRVQIRNVYGNGKDEQNRKNASDIELSIDAMETYYKNKDIDTYVFITADSDMIPIMSRLVYKGKKVHLYYIGGNISQYQHITAYADIECDLLQLFEIGEERKEASYWFDKAKEEINNWHNEPKNANKSLGGKWLKDLLKANLFVSDKLASSIIAEMEKTSLIEQDDNKGYIIK